MPLCGQRHGEIISYTYKLMDSNDEILHTGSTEDDTVTFNGLVPSTQYSFSVAANTSVGMGPYSDMLEQNTEGIINKLYEINKAYRGKVMCENVLMNREFEV